MNVTDATISLLTSGYVPCRPTRAPPAVAICP